MFIINFIPYCNEEIGNISAQLALQTVKSQKFDAEFIQDAEWQDELTRKESAAFFVRPQATLVGRVIRFLLLPRLLCLLQVQLELEN